MMILAACAPAATQPPPTPTADAVAIGRQIYATQCVECHGERAEGHALPSAPALDGSEHAWHHPDWQLRQFIHEGKLGFGPVNMPAFGDELTDEQIEHVIAYVKSLWGEQQRQFQEEINRRLILPTPTP